MLFKQVLVEFYYLDITNPERMLIGKGRYCY